MKSLKVGRYFFAIILLFSLFSFTACNDNVDDVKKKEQNNELAKIAELKKIKEAEEAENARLKRELEEINKKLEAQSNPEPKFENVEEGSLYSIVKLKITVEKEKHDGKKWDTTGAPDISGKIEFPDGNVLYIDKVQNSYVASAEIKNIKLRKGDRIRLFLEDRDIKKHDLIASGDIVFNGEKELKTSIGSAFIEIELIK